MTLALRQGGFPPGSEVMLVVFLAIFWLTDAQVDVDAICSRNSARNIRLAVADGRHAATRCMAYCRSYRPVLSHKNLDTTPTPRRDRDSRGILFGTRTDKKLGENSRKSRNKPHHSEVPEDLQNSRSFSGELLRFLPISNGPRHVKPAKTFQNRRCSPILASPRRLPRFFRPFCALSGHPPGLRFLEVLRGVPRRCWRCGGAVCLS